MKLYLMDTSSNGFTGSKRCVRNTFNKWSALSCSKSVTQLQNCHELLVRYRPTSMGLVNSTSTNRFFVRFFFVKILERRWICTKCVVRDVNKEHRVVSMFIPDETKHVPLNYTFNVEGVFVSYYDREINCQIKHWRKHHQGRPKVSEGILFCL